MIENNDDGDDSVMMMVVMMMMMMIKTRIMTMIMMKILILMIMLILLMMRNMLILLCDFIECCSDVVMHRGVDNKFLSHVVVKGRALPTCEVERDQFTVWRRSKVDRISEKQLLYINIHIHICIYIYVYVYKYIYIVCIYKYTPLGESSNSEVYFDFCMIWGHNVGGAI